MRRRLCPQLGSLPGAIRALLGAGCAFAILASTPANAAAPFRKIGEMELRLAGISATVDPVNPVIPKNLVSGVRIVVTAGGAPLSAAQLQDFLGSAFEIRAVFSGPGTSGSMFLPQPGEAQPADPLLLLLPPQAIVGDYRLSNIQVVAANGTVLDVEPRTITVQIIDQVLVTSVKTRPLTLDEIREKGIILDSDAYLGFEFTLGLKLESTPVNFSFPVVFDRAGIPLPQALVPPPPPPRGSVAPLPTIVPMLLEAQAPPQADGTPGPRIPLTTPSGEPIRIPSVLVIPGNVGYLKQFFSAQLLVADGAPVGSGLSVHDVTGTIRLPFGADGAPGGGDDPLALPDTTRGAQDETLHVRSLGPDGEPGTGDDGDVLRPGEQGQAEFLIRGDREGFHTIDFDIAAVLEGLPTGPVNIAGKASGGVLVRNPYFDMTFTTPSVVRTDERFDVFITVTNIGRGIGNDIHVDFDSAAFSGAELLDGGDQRINTLRPGDSTTLKYAFKSEVTGQVAASYLRFDTQDGARGHLNFALGVGERGVPLSPDTLVLPAAVDTLPPDVVRAAMRVLGQAWSIANAPTGTLPAGVTRVSRTVAAQKALALAEAGLRVSLRQDTVAAQRDAVRDLVFDFFGASPLDPGFDQLLRETDAGRELAATLGAALVGAVQNAGGPLAFEREMADVAAAGPDFISFSANAGTALTLELSDGFKTTRSDLAGSVPGVVMLPIGSSSQWLGLVAAPAASRYELTVSGAISELSITLPRGDASFARYTVSGAEDGARLILDLARPDRLPILRAENSVSEERLPSEIFHSSGPHLLSATVIGPETLDGAGPFGLHTAFLFDRVVDATTAAEPVRYAIEDNGVRGAKRQLSGRIVFASLNLPEGPYLARDLTVSGMKDARGYEGATATVPLQSRLDTEHERGAIVSGRVVNADGTPVTTGYVTYANNVDLGCQEQLGDTKGIASRALGADGRYEFRYVRRDGCGYPFGITTQDPATGAVRSAGTFVQAAGQRIVLDIVLFGRGSVRGVVRDLANQPVPGADVVVLSATDPQSGEVTKTDGDGRYEVSGLTVGPVNVTAAKGIFVGHGAGRLDRAGTTSVVDVTLLGPSVSVSGVVEKLQDGERTLVPGVQVLYYVADTGETPALVGVRETDATGAYAFHDMPPGSFRIQAALNTRDYASITGTATAGDQLEGRDILIRIEPDAAYGTLRGTVRLPGGAPAARAIVYVEERGTLSGDDGSYEIAGIAVRPGAARQALAGSRDGLRQGSVSFVLNAPQTLVRDITLSGLGSAEFEVRNAAGQPVANQDVGLLGSCSNPCGCAFKKTGADGKVVFNNLPLGTVSVQAVQLGTVIDAARASASVSQDGARASAVLRFAGTGTVTGVVLDFDGTVSANSFGADVTISSNHFVNDGFSTCGLVPGVSHRVRTDTAGRFRVPRVNVGPVGVTASQPFLPTPVGAQGTLQVDGQELSLTLRLINTTAGRLSGIVRLPDDLTPAGAGVNVTASGSLPDVTVTTNAAGEFHFAKIFPEGYYTLTARDPVSGGVSQDRVYLRAGQDVLHDLRLKGRGSVRVRVVNGNDEPVESAYVKLTEVEFPGRRYEQSLDASNEGIASFERVFEGPFSVEVTSGLVGGRAASVLTAPGGTQEVKVRLTATGAVRGHFLQRDAQTPIPYGVVTLRVGGRVLGQLATQSAGDVGAFAFDYVPAGDVRVEAQDPLTARSAAIDTVLENEGQVLDLTLIAEGLGSVQGLVTLNGEAVPGAHVDLVSGSFRVRTLADGEGRYLIAGVPEGRVAVTGSLASGFLSGTAAGNLLGDDSALTLDVALRGAGSVTGQVLRRDGVTIAPASGLSLDAVGVGGGTQFATSDANGHFRFDRVPAGPVTITADDLTSLDFGSTSVEVPEAATATATILMNGVGSVAVTVKDAFGQVVPNARVTLTSDSTRYGGRRLFTSVADPLGVAVFPEVTAGRLIASASDPASGLGGTKSGPELTDRGQVAFEVALDPAGRVVGTVLQHDRAAAPGVRVLLLKDAGVFGSTTTDLSGQFAFENVPLGSFQAKAQELETGDGGTASGTLLTRGAVAVVEIVLNGSGTLRVHVQESDGAPVDGVDVSAVTTAPVIGQRAGQTDTTGLTILPGVLAGSVSIFASDPIRGSAARTTTTLAAGETRDVTLSLQPAGLVRGRVLAANGVDPVVGAVVRALGASQTYVTGNDGSFEINNLLLTGYRLEAVLGDRVRAARNVTLTAQDPVQSADLVFAPAGTVTGTVRDGDGNTLPSQTVSLQSLNPNLFLSVNATTDAFGRYTVRYVPQGAFNLYASQGANSAFKSGRIDRDGQTVSADLTILDNAVQLPQTRFDGNGIQWTVYEDAAIGRPTAYGVFNGPNGMFGGDGTVTGSGAPRLTLIAVGAGSTFVGSGYLGATALDGREIVVRQDGLAGLNVTRRAYLPADGYFVRYIDVLENPSASPVTVDVQEDVHLSGATSGFDGVVDSSSDDASVDPTDRWLVLDDANASDYYGCLVQPCPAHNPPLAVVYAGESAAAPAASVSSLAGNASRTRYRWNAVTVPAGGRVAFLHLLSVESDRARARAAAERLGALPPEALIGLSADDAQAIANFNVPADLHSALTPLPPADGVVTGRVLAGDGETSISDAVVVRLRSNSLYLNAPNEGFTRAGAFVLEPSRVVVPRQSFELSAVSGARIAVASGDFAAVGTRDLTTAAGRTLRYSSTGSLEPETAVDGNESLVWSWRAGDRANPAAGTPFFEVGLPNDAAVQHVRLRGANFLRARVEVRDALNHVLWSSESDLAAGVPGALDLDVPNVNGARSVRVVDVVDTVNPPGFAELSISGDGDLGPTGRATQDIVFSGTGVLVGRLLQSDGVTPVLGAKVFLYDAAHVAQLADRSAPAGTYRYVLLTPGTYSLEAWLPGASSATLSTTVEIAADQRSVRDVVFPPTGGVHGTLHTTTGSAAMATVRLESADGAVVLLLSNVNGAYGFAAVPPGDYTLSVTRSAILGTVVRHVTIVAGVDAALDVVVPPRGQLNVTVTSDGLPVQSATLAWRSDARPDFVPSFTTDVLGRRGISNVVGYALQVRALYPGSNSLGRIVDATFVNEGDVVDVAIELPPVDSVSGTITGTVRRAGVVLPNVRVRVVDVDGVVAGETTTDAAGHYSYAPAPTGAVRVRAHRFNSNGGSPIEETVNVLAGATSSLDLDVPGALRVAGERLVFRAQLSAGALVSPSLSGQAAGGLGALSAPLVEAYDPAGALVGSGAGTFSFVPQASGAYAFVARAATSQTGGFALDVGGSQSLPLVRPTGAVTGTVTRRGDGLPASSVRVRVSAGLFIANATSDTSGRYRVVGIPAGPFVADAIDAAGVVIGSAAGSVAEPGESNADIAVSAHGTVTATVKRGVVGLAGLDVAFESDDAAAPAADRARHQTTGADGSATVSLPAGQVTARVADPDSGVLYEASGALAADGTLALEIAFVDGTSTLRGTIRFQDGTPGAGAVVALSGFGSRTTDSAGEYQFTGLPSGSYQLNVTVAGQSRTRSVTLDGGVQVEDFSIAVHMLRGTLREPTGESVAGALVAACGQVLFSQSCVSTTTAADGSYQFVGPPNWRRCDTSSSFCRSVFPSVGASVNDGSNLSASSSFSFDYLAPTIRTVNLTLPESGRVVGTVHDHSGDPVAGASVSLGWTRGPIVADAEGRFVFPHVRTGAVYAFGESPVDRIPGLSETGTVVAREDLTLDVTLTATGTISGVLLDSNGAPVVRDVSFDALEAPTRSGTLGGWHGTITTGPDGSFNLVAPVGGYRVVFYGEYDAATCNSFNPAAAEGELASGAVTGLTLIQGSHEIAPFLEGPLGGYGLESACDAARDVQPVSTSVAVAGGGYFYGSSYLPVVQAEYTGRAYRSLREIRDGLVIRKQEFVPASGAFARTLTILTNTRTQPVAVDLPSTLSLDPGEPPATGCFNAWELLGSSSGDADFDASDHYVTATRTVGGNLAGMVIGNLLVATEARFDRGGVGDCADAGTYPGSFDVTHPLTLPAGATRALMTFTVLRAAGDPGFESQVQALADLSDPEALAGLTAEDKAAIANFEIPGLTRLAGRVEDSNGTPAAAHVTVVANDGSTAAETDADAAGEFELTNVAPGDYTVVAVAASNRPGRSTVGVADGQTNETVVVLLADGDLGTVNVHASIDDPATSLAGVEVAVTVGGYAPWKASAALDDNGDAQLTGVPAGAVRVTLGSPYDTEATASLDAAATVQVEFALTSNGTIEGDVIDADGSPVPNARISLLSGDGQFVDELDADDTGAFSFAARTGSYQLFAMHPVTHRTAVLEPVVVNREQTTSVVVQLGQDESFGALHVVGVFDGTGQPAAGLPFEVTSEAYAGRYRVSGVLDANGTATLPLVPEITVDVRIGSTPPDLGWGQTRIVLEQTNEIVIGVGDRREFPFDLTGGDGHPYVVRSADDVRATVDDECDPYCTGYSEIYVGPDGEYLPTVTGPYGHLGLSNRQVSVEPAQGLGVRTEKRFFVPASGRFVRIMEVVENLTAAPLALGYDIDQGHNTPLGRWDVVATSSGDAAFDAEDSFAVMTNEADPDSPAMAWVYSSPAATGVFHYDTGFYVDGPWTVIYDQGQLTLAPGQKAVVLRFSAQREHGDVAGTLAQAEALADLSDPEALTGLTAAEKAAIVNFVVP